MLFQRSLRWFKGLLLILSSFNSLQRSITFLAEAEAVINSRPLVYVSEDFGCGFSLTPADFLGLNPKSGIPVIEIHGPHDPDYGKKSSTDKLVEIWGKGQQHLNSLWKVWKDDYLLNLRERR